MRVLRRTARALAKLWHMRAWRGDVTQSSSTQQWSCEGEDNEANCCCPKCLKRREAYNPEEADKLQPHWHVRCTNCGLKFSFAFSCLEYRKPQKGKSAAEMYLYARGWTARGAGRWGDSYRCPGCTERVRMSWSCSSYHSWSSAPS